MDGCDEPTFGGEQLADDATMINNADASVPLGMLDLEEGDVCFLPVTIDRTVGLVKNQRVVVVQLRWHAVRVRLDASDGPPTFHTLARCKMACQLHNHRGLNILRTQLPLIHAYALTVNKSQGQTLDGVLLDLRSPFFDHGHAYGKTQRKFEPPFTYYKQFGY